MSTWETQTIIISSTSRKTELYPMELVHSDVWDPCQIEFVLGFRYSIVFIDNFSRMT